jgi:hypothetical protein
MASSCSRHTADRQIDSARLQHSSGTPVWGCYVVVRTAARIDLAEGRARYQALFVDQSTVGCVTLEQHRGGD